MTGSMEFEAKRQSSPGGIHRLEHGVSPLMSHCGLPISWMSAIVILGVAIALVGSPAAAQPVPEAGQQPADDPRLAETVPLSEAATFVYANRPITLLRARVLTNQPADRARVATEILDRMVDDGTAVGPVTASEASGAMILSVGGRAVLTLVPADINLLAGESLEQKAADAASALTVALAEASELRTPSRLLSAAALVLLATVLFGVAVFLVRLAYRRVHRRLVGLTGEALGRVLPGTTAGEPVVLVTRFLGVGLTVTAFAVWVLLIYWWLTFSLRQFPYTRPWGETLRSRLLNLIATMGGEVVAALPGLFFVVIVVVVTRLFVRVSDSFFTGVERGRVDVGWAHPDTAGATRRLVAVALWLFALVVSYPFLPGSGSDAFKGVSVFLGLVVSLGSSGIVNQMMSGLTLIYSRALTIGEFVRIGDTEGFVTDTSLLSVKLRTVLGEDVTVPNTVVVGQSTTNYTKLAPAGGSYLSTFVTIGYDTPWRQVRALLLLAASHTENVRSEPPPTVIKASLEDPYVRYHLLVCVEDSADRVGTRDDLHASILDTFNEYGVQIMSPSYEGDPETPKIVPPDRWFAEPAVQPATEQGSERKEDVKK